MNTNQIQVGEPYIGSSVTIGDMKTYGWCCPKCGRVYSPSTSMCLYCGGNNNVMPETSNAPTKREWWRDNYTIGSDANTVCVNYDHLPSYTTITAWS